jgi:hypothetical protein
MRLKYSIRIESGWVLQGNEEKQKWFDNAETAVKQLWETKHKEGTLWR